MKYLILFLPLFLYSGEYFGKIVPYKSYTLSSKVAGLVTYTNDKLITHVANDQSIVKIDDEVAKINYEVARASYEIKKDFYQAYKKLSTKSKSQKDNEKISYLNAKQAYIKAKDDLQSRNVKAKNLYIEEILVKPGSYVVPGTALIKASDISKAKIAVFVSAEDIQDIEHKTILVDGKSDFKVFRHFKIADKVQVSSYKLVLAGPAPKRFSSIAKVQIK